MKTLLRSFAGGEITPELFGRVDLGKYQTGLAKCLNFEIRPQGSAVNRAGLEYIIHTKDSSKRSVLIPFIYSTTQAYVLEFGDLYLRIHTLASTVLETGLTITGITRANPGVLTYVGADPSDGQWEFLSGIVGMTELNGRYVKVANVNAGANTFELTDLDGVNIDTSAYTAWSSGGTAARVYEIASPYAEADLAALEITQSSDVLTITNTGYQTRELRRSGATSWAFNTVTVAPTQAAPTAVTVTPNAAGGATYTYVVTAVAADGREESLASAVGSNAGCQLLSVAGAFNTVTWTDASGAIRYNVYKGANGLYGYVGQALSGGGGFRDENVTADVSQTPPESDNPISSANNYPGAVGYFQGRRWFAGSNNKPQNVWATRSGTESNLTYSIPTRDSDAITARLTARQANLIRHLVPLGDLLALTSGAEWLINSGGNAGPITPGNIDYTPQGYSGASQVRPVVTDSSVLYAEDRGGRVREIQYSWEKQGYKSSDVSLMAPHLFDGYTIVSMAYARSPNPTLWCVRSDGLLLGLTYIPAQQVLAWHQHSTLGQFESIAVIPEGTDDVMYAIVKRTINGASKRYIERLHSRRFATLEDSFVVDAGLFYNGTPATSIGGLWHLVGEEVSILADGAVKPAQTVGSNGKIALSKAASKVAVGKQITADLETLPLAWEMEAFAQGSNKSVNAVYLRVLNSSSVNVGPAFDNLTESTPIIASPYAGAPPALRTGTIKVTVSPSWSYTAPICVRNTDPLPLSILSIIPSVTIGG